MLAKFEPKEYNKLEDTDYKMEEYVRVPKEKYNYYINGKQISSEKLMQQLFRQVSRLQTQNVKLGIKLDDLKDWLEEEIHKLNPKKLELGELNLILDDVKFYSYIQLKEVLERLG
jgi:hypothetical protein